MNEEQTNVEKDWRNNISEPKDTLKVKPDSAIIVTFQDEGIVKSSIDYGNSVVFGVKTEENDELKLWYVNSENYNLLGQIKSLGKLEGKRAKIIRKGSKRSDTRYTIEEVKE